MITKMHANRALTATRLERLKALVALGTPPWFQPIFTALHEAIVAAHNQGVQGTPTETRVNSGKGGTWTVSRLQADGHAWVVLRWPSDAPVKAIAWLTKRATTLGLVGDRQALRRRELWIHLGSSN